MRHLTRFIVAATLLGCASSTFAKEGGDQSVTGAESFLAGALPPTGTYWVNYLGHYQGALQNDRGDEVKGPNGKNLKVGATFNVFRFVHVTPHKILGADYGMQVVVPVVNQRFNVFGTKFDDSHIGDIAFAPVVLGWHLSKNLHIVGAVDFFLPTGKWEKNNPASQIGANYYSIEPVVAVSYLADSGFEASAKMMYNIKASKNKDTHYKSGDEFHFDYVLGYRQGPWAYGLGGYYLKQVSDDKQHGKVVGHDGNRGEVLAIGPQFAYTSKTGEQFVVKWDHEAQAENRFKGDKVWFKYIHRF